MEYSVEPQKARNMVKSQLAQLQTRLIISLICLGACLLLSLSAGLIASNNQQQLGEQKVSLHDAINTLLQAMIDQETGLRGYIATDSANFLEPLTSGETQYAATLQRLKELTGNGRFQGSAEALTQVDLHFQAWATTYRDVQLANMQNSQLQVARAEALNAQGKVLFDANRQAVAALQQSADRDLAAMQSSVNSLNIGLMAGALLLTVLVIIWLWRTFRQFTGVQRDHLEHLKQASVAFGAGDLAVRVPLGYDTEFNELGQTFNAMATRLQEQQRALRGRDIVEQVSYLNSILTESLDLETLMRNFLQRLLNLLDIQIAAFYRYRPEDQTLTLFSSQGLPATELQATFALQEGLIGRVAASRMPLMMSSSEQIGEAFQVKTMLGAALPSSMYHLPLAQGADLLGVLVLGSLYVMSDQTRNVLNVVSGNLATAINNAQAYEHIQNQAQELAVYAYQQEQSNLALRQQRDELTVLNSALEEANRVRSQFLSTMSHELRTPLTSIIGFGQMIVRSAAKSPLSPRQSGNIDRILKNAQHLLTLINDVLDLAKIEAGRMDFNAAEVNLADLIHAVVDETRSIAIERRLSLRSEIDERVSTLETDARKVRQILVNLISNALKFTEKGSVLVSARLRVQQDENEQAIEEVVISVEDTGIGIDPEKQAHIFEAFYQVDNSSSRNYGGTGLGLSIVHELTALLGGKLEFQSEQGQGSTFNLILPLHVRDRKHFIRETRLNGSERSTIESYFHHGTNHDFTPLPVLEGSDSDPYLVVAIDDNPDVLELIHASLEQSPYRVIGVQDPTRAVEVIQELRPDAITLDIMMPQINGWQILHQLKSNPQTASIPVILLTVLEDRSAGYVLGADEYLVKPVARDALLKVLTQLMARTHEDGQRAGTPSEEKQGSVVEATLSADGNLKPILLVHNEQDIHRLMERLIKDRDYKVQMTHDGQEVLEVIEKAHPDILMMFVKLGKAANAEGIVIAGTSRPLSTSATEAVEKEDAGTG